MLSSGADDMNIIPRPVAVEPRDGYTIWLRFSDGVEGEVDLSYLSGIGVFKVWDDRSVFENVYIDGTAITWGCPDGFGPGKEHTELDTCSETYYANLLGFSPADLDAIGDDFYSAVADRKNCRSKRKPPIFQPKQNEPPESPPDHAL